jgi:hypothetical protein
MKKTYFLPGGLVILFVLILNGCVSIPESPSPRFYMPGSISSKPVDEKFSIASGVVIAVGPIAIPESQDRPQIVTKNKDGTISFAQFDRWAEPLDAILAGILSDDLASLLPAASFHIFPCNYAIPVDYQVIVEIIKLDSELDKDMIFVGQWSIIDARTKKPLLIKRSMIVEPINPHDYFGLSKALGAVCSSLSKEVANSLSELVKQGRP